MGEKRRHEVGKASCKEGSRSSFNSRVSSAPAPTCTPHSDLPGGSAAGRTSTGAGAQGGEGEGRLDSGHSPLGSDSPGTHHTLGSVGAGGVKRGARAEGQEHG